jgi:hypothetical protein
MKCREQLRGDPRLPARPAGPSVERAPLGGRGPDLILLAIEDVTERKRAERTVRESAAMTRAGVETAIDGVITLDERATILSFNPAAERIYGVASAEMIGQTFADLDVPTDGDHAGGSPYLSTGGPRCRRDGTPFLPISTQRVRLSGHGGSSSSATPRAQAHGEADPTYSRLMAHVRVATIERFRCRAAHELSNRRSPRSRTISRRATTCGLKSGPRRLLTARPRGAEALRGAIVGHLRACATRGAAPESTTSAARPAATRWLSYEMENERIMLHLDIDAAASRPSIASRSSRCREPLQNAVDAIREATRRRETSGSTAQRVAWPRRPSTTRVRA